MQNVLIPALHWPGWNSLKAIVKQKDHDAHHKGLVIFASSKTSKRKLAKTGTDNLVSKHHAQISIVQKSTVDDLLLTGNGSASKSANKILKHSTLLLTETLQASKAYRARLRVLFVVGRTNCTIAH